MPTKVLESRPWLVLLTSAAASRPASKRRWCSPTLAALPLPFCWPIEFWLFSFWKMLWCLLSSRPGLVVPFCQYEGFSCSLWQITPKPSQRPFRGLLKAMMVYGWSDVMPGGEGAGRECRWDDTGRDLVTMEPQNGNKGVDGTMCEISHDEKKFLKKTSVIVILCTYCVLSDNDFLLTGREIRPQSEDIRSLLAHW